MGLGSSKFEKDLLNTNISEDERFYGLENFGNTCYCNSVLQALYFCIPFRNSILQYYTKNNLHIAANRRNMEDSLLLTLVDLFVNITSQKKRTGVVPPKRFVDRLRYENEMFRGHMHQDAHEFLNVLLNSVAESLQKHTKQQQQQQQRLMQQTPMMTQSLNSSGTYSQSLQSSGRSSLNNSNNSVNIYNNNHGSSNSISKLSTTSSSVSTANQHQRTDSSTSETASVTTSIPKTTSDTPDKDIKTFIHDIFEGTLTNETKCLTCESVTNKDESFLDLSIDIDQNTSITSCLSNFSSVEILSKNDKFFCDKCISLQEAQKRMKIKKLPNTLIIHLKRFKFIEKIQQYKKLNYRVVFPFEIIIQNTTGDIEEPDKKYNLFAVVIHAGNGPNHGHYTCMVKSNDHWIGFDDDNMGIVNESDIFDIFGSSTEYYGGNECGYLLFYQSASTSTVTQFKPPPPQSSSYIPSTSTFTSYLYGGNNN
ncbi:hypothetical protein SAMD00019534_111880 [Acytostelium subglobosum LB1]|uniref:hypothetical protein n=1 Tax=Acytostelium subglobosum LB1 TaxID=1410327 RepID=UPI0006451FFC|nr:hypothetical protein SAMD00019534_111880 [Acytostelium subglobosum LB1]GAM28012.1 hypothetical protein SAMD00019534_111880 [Acytostelium subglobosum LB1]|eukprot:XP_012748971.1 hypothetical protein SAMD00019534_111880 [Acytostelium subglobosum LB1]